MTSKNLERILAEVRRRKETGELDWLKPVTDNYVQNNNISENHGRQEVYNSFIDTYSRLRKTGDGEDRSVAKALYIVGAKYTEESR